MNTENTIIPDHQGSSGWVLYDGDCRRCRRFAARSAAILAARGFHLAPLQAPWVRCRLRLDEASLLREMRVLTPAGNLLGGADAVVFLASRVWWARPLAGLARLPGWKRVLHAAYRWVANRRHCPGRSCEFPGPAPGRSDGKPPIEPPH